MRNLVATALTECGRIAKLAPDGAIDVLPAYSYVRISFPRKDIQSRSVEVLGTQFPAEPGTCGGTDPVAWWIRPDAWLLVSARHSSEALVEALQTSCAGRACAIVDVSDAFVALQVRGPKACELLSRGTGLDVSSASFTRGRATRIRFTDLAVFMRLADTDCFELIVERSAAAWLADWLRVEASTLS